MRRRAWIHVLIYAGNVPGESHGNLATSERGVDEAAEQAVAGLFGVSAPSQLDRGRGDRGPDDGSGSKASVKD